MVARPPRKIATPRALWPIALDFGIAIVIKSRINPDRKYRRPANINGGLPPIPNFIATRSEANTTESMRIRNGDLKRSFMFIIVGCLVFPTHQRLTMCLRSASQTLFWPCSLLAEFPDKVEIFCF
jgi:hypothetical protein